MPANEELAQRLDEMRQDTKDGFRELKDAINKLHDELRDDYVSRAEYDAWTQATSQNVADARTSVAAVWRTIDSMRNSEASRFRSTVFWAVGTVLGFLTLLAAAAAALASFI